ncbi:MAG: hypothetical protein EKK37_17500 [Sphingobacteriales bacterium]|nr:MAG: hypothetical protein EKK37_17500 [Sphingobacteriales bacterium]
MDFGEEFLIPVLQKLNQKVDSVKLVVDNRALMVRLKILESENKRLKHRLIKQEKLIKNYSQLLSPVRFFRRLFASKKTN